MSYQDPLLAYLPDGKQRKRRKKRADVKEGITHADARQKEYSVYQDWRDNSLTLQRIRSNAARFQQTCDAVKRGLQQAQNQIADQVDSSRDAVVVALKQQLKSARTKLRRALQQQQQQQEQKATEELCADLAACSKCVKGSKQDSQSFAIGSLLFGALAFVCGNVPGLLPSLYLAFAAVALPWRIHQFYCKRLTFYLLDFCYVSFCLQLLHEYQRSYASLDDFEWRAVTCSGQIWPLLPSWSLAAATPNLGPWCTPWLMDLWQGLLSCGRARGCLAQLHMLSGKISGSELAVP